ncbi:unnamed protein product [Rhizophagus irregularis]|nr:unnamed protein product [Rhizophagus irregularis]
MSSSSLRKVGGCPITICSFCEYHWSIAKVVKLKKHLIYECTKVDFDTKISILMMLTNNCDDSENDSYDTSTTSTTKFKKRRSNDRSQTHIDNHYENFPTPLDKEDQINKTLAKMFVCCNLPFALIEHPFFIEFVKTLRATYNLSSC